VIHQTRILGHFFLALKQLELQPKQRNGEAFPQRTETAKGVSLQVIHSEGAVDLPDGERSNLKIFLNKPGIAVDTLLIQPVFVPAYFWAVMQKNQ
jgi:hypothetical protein